MLAYAALKQALAAALSSGAKPGGGSTGSTTALAGGSTTASSSSSSATTAAAAAAAATAAVGVVATSGAGGPVALQACATATPSVRELLRVSALRAFDGGVSGAAAMACQVTSLMWLHTTMNYQYRYGGTTRDTLRTLYRAGGVRRFYRGYGVALAQGPLARFVDTAANTGTISLLNAMDSTRGLPLAAKTVCASLFAGAWRVMVMPVDTLKTVLQVEGARGLTVLRAKIATGGVRVLYSGALAASSSTLLSHFTWFGAHNYLDAWLPKPARDAPHRTRDKLLRNAAIGFTCSVCADTVSNSVRVVKTTKQTHQTPITYAHALKLVIDADGIGGLFGRGLKTRVCANGLQGMLFAVMWRAMDEQLVERRRVRDAAAAAVAAAAAAEAARAAAPAATADAAGPVVVLARPPARPTPLPAPVDARLQIPAAAQSSTAAPAAAAAATVVVPGAPGAVASAVVVNRASQAHRAFNSTHERIFVPGETHAERAQRHGPSANAAPTAAPKS